MPLLNRERGNLIRSVSYIEDMPQRRQVSWIVLLFAVALGFLARVVLPDSPATGGSDGPCGEKFPRGQPQIEEDNVTFLCRSQYAVLHDDDRKVPLYVAEHLVGADLALDVSRTNDFRPDPDIPAGERAELNDYRGSGFDRGHMSPAANSDTPQEMSESFYLSNMVPQNGVMNEGIWAGLERAVRACAQNLGEAYVITGALFEGRVRTIGPGKVAVPTAMYKIIIAPGGSEARAFVMPNRALRRTTNYAPYEVTVAELEERTGIRFFPQGGVSTDRKGSLCANAFGS